MLKITLKNGEVFTIRNMKDATKFILSNEIESIRRENNDKFLKANSFLTKKYNLDSKFRRTTKIFFFIDEYLNQDITSDLDIFIDIYNVKYAKDNTRLKNIKQQLKTLYLKTGIDVQDLYFEYNNKNDLIDRR